MIKFNGDIYTINIENIVEYTRLTKKTNFEDVITRINKSKSSEDTVEDLDVIEETQDDLSSNEPPMLDVAKWELVRNLLDVVLGTVELVDNKMPLHNQLPLSYIMSLNTLIKYKFIIKT